MATDIEKVNELITQGIDPSLAEALIKMGGYQAQQQGITQALRRHQRGYGGYTPGRYGRFVGDPLGAAIGGFQAGKAMAQQPQLQQGAQDFMRQFAESRSPFQASGTGAPPPTDTGGGMPSAMAGPGGYQHGGTGDPMGGSMSWDARPTSGVEPKLQQPIEGSQAHPYGTQPTNPWLMALLRGEGGFLGGGS